MIHPPSIKRTSTLHLLKNISNVNKTDAKIAPAVTPPKEKVEMNPHLASGIDKINKAHLSSDANIQLLETHPNEAYILACALTELNDEKLIEQHRELFKQYPKSSQDIAKVISQLKNHQLLTSKNLQVFQESKINFSEAYYIQMIFKKLAMKALLTQENFELVLTNVQYATQICSLLNKLDELDQEIFGKIMKFADRAGYIATRLIISEFTELEVFGDINRFNYIIDELSQPIALPELEEEPEISSNIRQRDAS